MTKEEENLALEKAWDLITEWVKTRCQFPGTREFKFPHDPYHWTKLEVYPSGNCAILTGSWGNPGEYRPHMIHGHEELRFGTGDYEISWSGNERDFPKMRERHLIGRSPSYCDHLESFWLLRELYDNWDYVRGSIIAAIAQDNKLKEFKA